MNEKPRNCPVCNKGSNISKFCIHQSLSYKFIKLASEWHPTENGNKKPEDFLPNSGVKAWWICNNNFNCKCEHKWEAIISDRTRNLKGCPFCSHHRCCIHESIFYTHSNLIKEWDVEKKQSIKT